MNFYNPYKIVLLGGADSSQQLPIYFDGHTYHTSHGPLELATINAICDRCNSESDLMYSDRSIDYDVCMACLTGPRRQYERYISLLSARRLVPDPVQPRVNLIDRPISRIQNVSSNCWFNSLLQFLSRFPNAENIDPAIRSQFSLNLANLINNVRQGLPINYQEHIRDSIFNQWHIYCRDNEIPIELKQSIYYTLAPPNNWQEHREIISDLVGQQDPVEFLPLWSQLLGWPVTQYGDLGIHRATDRQTLQGFINRNVGLLHGIHDDNIAVIVRDRDQQDFNGNGHEYVNRSILQFSETVNIVEDGAEVQFTPVSVIVHNGVDAAGHYRCFVRDESNWVILDDDLEPRIAGPNDMRDLETGSRIIHFRRLNL